MREDLKKDAVVFWVIDYKFTHAYNNVKKEDIFVPYPTSYYLIDFLPTRRWLCLATTPHNFKWIQLHSMSLIGSQWISVLVDYTPIVLDTMLFGMAKKNHLFESLFEI